jgi:hypothetical protein
VEVYGGGGQREGERKRGAELKDAREEAEEVERAAALEAASKVWQHEQLRGGLQRVDRRRCRDKREMRCYEASRGWAVRVEVILPVTNPWRNF